MNHLDKDSKDRFYLNSVTRETRKKPNIATFPKMFPLKGTHNQSQSLKTQIIKILFSIQICSIHLTPGTVKV